jgi:hypothetical protein
MHKRSEEAGIDLDLEPFLAVDRDDRDPYAVVELQRIFGLDVHLPELEGHVLPHPQDGLAGRIAQAAPRPGVQDDLTHGADMLREPATRFANGDLGG